MASKRPRSPELIASPFIKKRNQSWTLEAPLQSHLDESAPGAASEDGSSSSYSPPPQDPTSAAIESGEAHVSDHLARFTSLLSRHTLSQPPTPLLSLQSYASHYRSCAGSPDGAHFVVHQHDHPVAGTHYDLRLQINETSSVSWAIMYGLPGDPNSVRPLRNATETRIHCLWNHLVETASAETGSLLIWDTGTYTVLPRQSKHAPRADPSSPSSSPPAAGSSSQQGLLHAAFQDRKIRLRLHGAKLPDPYVINLRLTKIEDADGRAKSARKPRTRRRIGKPARHHQEDPESGSEEDEDDAYLVPNNLVSAEAASSISTMERELRELEDAEVRRTNAYTGASNTIGSVHQRKWLLSLDRPACGLVERKAGARTRWESPDIKSEQQEEKVAPLAQATPADSGTQSLTFPFYVRGVNHERSVVTGRQGHHILRDEKVTRFVPRKGWTPVLK